MTAFIIMSTCVFTAFHHFIEFHPRIISSHVHVKTFPCVFDAMASASSKKKNYKGRSPNVLRFIDSCGSEAEMGTLMPANLAAGARLAAKTRVRVWTRRQRGRTSFGSLPLRSLPGKTVTMLSFLAPTKGRF